MTEISSTFGNFKFNLKAELTEKQTQVLATAGLLQIAQRSPATAAEKELAKYDKKRPEGFKRTDIPFSPEGAAVLKKHLSKLQVDVSDDETKEVLEDILVDVEVSEHVPGEGATPKFTREREIYVARAGENRLDELAAKVGYAGDTGDGTNDGAPVEFLRAMKAFIDAEAAKIAKGL